MNLKTFKTQFDRVFTKTITHHVGQAKACTSDSFIRDLIQHLEALGIGGGKRVRPYMACLAYETVAKKLPASVIQLFTGLELFHLFALVHDDIIDHGIERHGIATAHLFAHQQLTKHKRRGDLKHIADAHALLLGDLLFSWANHQMMRNSGFSAKNFQTLRGEYETMIDEVIVGQMVDVDSMTRTNVASGLIEEKMRLKTASYTFVRPLRMGAVLAGGNAVMLNFCDAFGLPLGLAFQIQDDYLDLTASSKDIHKTVFSDLREHQHTVFTQFIVEQGTKAEKKVLKEMLGSSLSEKDRSQVQRLFELSGALAYGQSIMTDYFNQAEDALERVKLTDKQKWPFAELVQFIRSRTH